MKFRTINESNDFQDLTDSQLELFSSKLIQLLLAKNKRKLLYYRGVNKEYLSGRYTNSDSISESELYRRLFYYGDKSKNFLKDEATSKMSPYLKNIEDMSYENCKKIFDKLKNLKKSKDPKIKSFVQSNKEFFDFFEKPDNKVLFVNNIIEIGFLARDYYLCILHKAGNIGVGDKSIHISTSSSYESACEFGDNIILYIHRRTTSKRNTFQTKNLPLLNKGSDIFPEQQELTVSAGLFAHNMLGVIHRDKELFTVNPHIFADKNLKVDLSKNPLHINQEGFGNNIALETSFTRWVYTYDFLEMFCGTEEANNLFF